MSIYHDISLWCFDAMIRTISLLLNKSLLNKFLRHTKIMQLRCNNKKWPNLITSKPKKLDSHKILVVNLSTESLDTEPSRYWLHHSYVDKNKNVKRNVSAELESLSIFLDKYMNPSSKENFHDYLRVTTNIITKILMIMRTRSNHLQIYGKMKTLLFYRLIGILLIYPKQGWLCQ